MFHANPDSCLTSTGATFVLADVVDPDKPTEDILFLSLCCNVNCIHLEEEYVVYSLSELGLNTITVANRFHSSNRILSLMVR